ncbi:MAG: hypothetical protein MUO59_00300 [Actinobacteria bacterium]|nr:hypothetical protein [Actinomycetota bacterium]
MSRVWLEVFLGNIGKYIITFITSYYYFIIPPIIAYGVFLTISSYNLKRIEKSVSGEIVRQARLNRAKYPEINYIELVDMIKIDWGKIMDMRSFFPYISEESDLWVSKTTRENIRDIIMHNDAKIRLVLERNGIHIIGERPEIRKNLYTEFIHRITRRD